MKKSKLFVFLIKSYSDLLKSTASDSDTNSEIIVVDVNEDERPPERAKKTAAERLQQTLSKKRYILDRWKNDSNRNPTNTSESLKSHKTECFMANGV